MTKPEEILKAAGFSASDIKQTYTGQICKDPVASASDRDLAVKFALLVKAPTKDLRHMLMTTTKTSEKDPNVTQSGLIIEGTLDEFADLKLTPNGKDMTKEYLKASPGSTFNLSNDEISNFRSFKKGSGEEEVEKALREVLHQRYLAYRENGLAGVLPYARSSRNNFDPGQELRQKTECAELMKNRVPAFHKYLLQYPNAKPDGAEESYSWVNYNIDDKPTIVLIHRMGLFLPEGDYVFCERHFYVSRSHNSLQGIGGAFPAEDDSLILYVSRTSTDQVSGFGGSAKRAIGSKILAGRVAANFERARKVEEDKIQQD